MVRLREVSRTAAFAWSPGTDLPLLATGTRAGAVDADFSNDTQLEIWDLDLGPGTTTELKPVATISTDSRFHDISWGRISQDQPRGLIAGGLESGDLDIWSAGALLQGDSKPLVSRTKNHSGAIKALQFNPFKSELLATAGAKGELFISDINTISNPFRLGNPATRADDIEAVDWNRSVAHILATGGAGGFITVWDLKARKENSTFNNMGRRPVSAVVWDPDSPVRMITASPDDQNTDILVWDLRNTNAPLTKLQGHEQGVLSLSWCKQDSELLLSCGKDNRTICWNPRTGAQLGEFPVVANWTFQTRWNPHNPALIATASFDGKISIQTLQSTGSAASQADTSAAPLDGEDFFNKPQADSQGFSFTLPKAPKWLERPCGVSFGFGGKVVSFSLEPAVSGKPRKSKISITQFSADSGVGSASESFEAAISSKSYTEICESRIESAATDEEKADWKVIDTLIASDPRKKLVDYLGFDSTSTTVSNTEKELPSIDAHANGTADKTNRLSGFFDNTGDDEFLSSMGDAKPAPSTNPFSIFGSADSDLDKKVTHALLLGNFEQALEYCLKEKRLSDAFMIAICGGQKCLDKVQKAYLTSEDKRPNYVRLLAAVAGKDLSDVVANADMSNWKEIMAVICTYSDQKDFADLCEKLGDRLDEKYSQASGKGEARKDASFCYLAGSKLEKVVKIWIDELHENEKSGIENTSADSTFAIHARSLQSLVEKVTVFRDVTKFRDPGQNSSQQWKLAALYDIYSEYADIVAAHGYLSIAEKYLDLIPAQYGGVGSARDRVKLASKKPTQQKAPAQAQRLPTRAASAYPPAPGQLPTQAPYNAGGYGAPAAATPAVGSYAPTSASAYAPAGYQPPQPVSQGGYQPPQQQYGGYASYGAPAPPRNTMAAPSVPPPSRAKDMDNWNDTPMVTKPLPPRKHTPSAPITTPFPGQAPFNPAQQPAQGPPPPGFRQTPPVAAPSGPPRGPPRMTSPPTRPSQAQSFQQPERPQSTNQYAPPASSFAAGSNVPQVPRGASPYNAPPIAGAPQTSRYTPAPASPSQTGFPSATGPRGGAPPTSAQYLPYGATPTVTPQQTQGPPGGPLRGPPSGPPGGPPGGPPRTAPQAGPDSRPGTSQSQNRSLNNATKHPAGDRSHISSDAQPIYTILSAEMERIKPLAPASAQPQVVDTEKRLALLFDHLNNDDLLKPDTVQEMIRLAQALANRDVATAQQIHVDIVTNKPEQCGQWMVGVKRLIRFAGATK